MVKKRTHIALTFPRKASQSQHSKRGKLLVHCVSSSSWPQKEYSRGFTMGFAYRRANPLDFFTLWCRQFTAGKRRGHQPTYTSVNNTPWPQCVTGEEDPLVIAGSGCSLIPIILLSRAYNSEHLHQLCPWVSNLYNYPIISDLFARDLGDFSIVDVILSSQYLCEHNSCFHCWNI